MKVSGRAAVCASKHQLTYDMCGFFRGFFLVTYVNGRGCFTDTYSYIYQPLFAAEILFPPMYASSSSPPSGSYPSVLYTYSYIFFFFFGSWRRVRLLEELKAFYFGARSRKNGPWQILWCSLEDGRPQHILSDDDADLVERRWEGGGGKGGWISC